MRRSDRRWKGFGNGKWKWSERWRPTCSLQAECWLIHNSPLMANVHSHIDPPWLRSMEFSPLSLTLSLNGHPCGETFGPKQGCSIMAKMIIIILSLHVIIEMIILITCFSFAFSNLTESILDYFPQVPFQKKIK